MAFLIPFIAAFCTFIYNYRKLLVLKKEIKKQIIIMSISDSEKIDKLDKTLSGFMLSMENRVTKLESKMGLYFGGYSLIGIVMLIYNLMKR